MTLSAGSQTEPDRISGIIQEADFGTYLLASTT